MNRIADRTSRRDFLQGSAATLTGGLLKGCAGATVGSNAGARPNLLLILVDDLGYGDLSAYGATDLQTPNIDRLIGEGMRFDYFYANCPVCSPTRAALLSGRYQEMVGVPGVIRTHTNNSWGYLDPNSTLISEALQPAGYQTAIIGKWHLGLESPNLPNERGFDFFHGYRGDMMDDYYNHRRHGINYMYRNEEEIDPKGHATDLFSQWACDYLRERKSGKPFFLYLAYNAPHTPIQPPRDWLDRVKKREPGLSDKRAKLAAFIEHLDHGIGKVLRTLDKTGMSQNTLVVFTSDNGGQVNVGANNGATRNGKGTLYEGGIRVPMCARWPGRIEPGTRSNRVALTMDLMPTLLDAAQVPVRHEIDGIGIFPTLQGKRQPEPKRDLFFGRREGGAYKGKTVEAIRRGDWKLLRPMPGKPFELYHLRRDPLEKTNLAKTETKKFRELREALEKQLERYRQVPWQPPKK